MKYRADIDGLRAVAVAPVVLFHAGIETFSGGFVGVDVFFVISGYLITGIILDEMRAGTFSVLAFYERRARRILPALFVVMAFTLAAAWFILLPIGYQSLAKSALSTTAFASNIYFWRQTGYFAGASEMLPLLHTWSLAVEEQFYIGFPLLLLLLLRWGQRMLALLTVAATLASFALSAWALDNTPSAAFYLIPTRAWELSLGALLALGVAPAARSRPPRELVALIGLVLVVAPVFIYTKGTAFPGLAALPPCLGTAAIIWAGLAPPASGPNTVSRLLGLAPVVFVGLISYSLYLWHWPLLVLARHLTVSIHLDQLTAIATIAVAAVAAIASWRFVERPFRNRALWGRMAVFTAAGAGAAAVAAASVAIVVLQGVPRRFDQTVVQLEAGGEGFSKKGEACLNKPLMNGEIMPACILGRPDGPVEFLLWGDSHAAALVPAFDVIAERTGMTGGIVVGNSCPALANTAYAGMGSPAGERRDCWQRNKSALEYIIRSPSVRLVILEGRWNAYLRDPVFVQMSSNGQETSGGQKGLELFLHGIEHTIERLSSAGKRVVILVNLPDPGFPVPWTLAMSTHTHTPWPRVPSPKEPSERMRTIFKKHGVIEIRMDEAICAGGVCKIADGTNTIFKDGNHLSEFGATTYFAPFLYDKLFGTNGAIEARATTFGNLTDGRVQ